MDVIGLPPNVANGTNRVNVFANAFASFTGFYKNGKLQLHGVYKVVVPILLGALLGAYIANTISNEDFRNIYRGLIFLVAIILFLKPKQWIREVSETERTKWWIAIPILFSLGIYAGLVQAGAGLFILVTLVMVLHKEIFEANAIKMLVIMLYSVFVIIMFHMNGLIDWRAGLTLAIAQATGAYLSAMYAPRIKQANLWAYRILIGIVILVILRELFMLLY